MAIGISQRCNYCVCIDLWLESDKVVQLRVDCRCGGEWCARKYLVRGVCRASFNVDLLIVLASVIFRYFYDRSVAELSKETRQNFSRDNLKIDAQLIIK